MSDPSTRLIESAMRNGEVMDVSRELLLQRTSTTDVDIQTRPSITCLISITRLRKRCFPQILTEAEVETLMTMCVILILATRAVASILRIVS